MFAQASAGFSPAAAPLLLPDTPQKCVLFFLPGHDACDQASRHTNKLTVQTNDPKMRAS